MAFNRYKTKETSRLGSLLIDKGIITELQLQKALEHQQTSGLRLGESLIALGIIEAKMLKKVLTRQKLIRTFVTGILMIISPVCPVLANQSNSGFQYSNAAIDIAVGGNNLAHKYSQNLNFQTNEFQSVEFDKQIKDRFVLGLKHNFSVRSSIKVGLGQSSYVDTHSGNYTSQELIPQVSIFTSRKRKKGNDNILAVVKNSNRFDRYKNTIPAVYSLTVKGYSLFEQSDNEMRLLGFDKNKNNLNRKFELMFSVTKRF